MNARVVEVVAAAVRELSCGRDAAANDLRTTLVSATIKPSRGTLELADMTKANDFVRALQTVRDPEVETVDSARRRQQDAWLGDLAAFAQVIRKWLVPVVEAKLASVVEKEFPIEEPDLGSYTAPGLEITLVVGAAPRTVLLRPRGMRIVGVVQSGGARVTGARGRVDLECGVAREILLRLGDKQETKWASFSKGEKETVNEDVFFHLLARLTGLTLK